jgi:polysaccharide deacetylase family protein (PEP-CTERM system associated)
VRATWFFLGEVASEYPDLVSELARTGHEIGVHGYHHDFVYNLTPSRFREQIKQAKELLEELSGCKILGYRAPAFSINHQTPWAFEILKELGFVYDSSTFPFRGRRYGTAQVAVVPFFRETAHGPLLEIPLSVATVGAIRLPCCGGGYLRHFPLCYTRWAMATIAAQNRSAVVYLHPYESDEKFDDRFFRDFLSSAEINSIRTQSRLQFRNRGQTLAKVSWLLKHYRFGPMAEVFAESIAACHTHPLPHRP